MTILEKLAKLEHEVSVLKYAIRSAEDGAGSWTSVGAVVRVGVLGAFRSVRSAVTAKETAERRQQCPHADIRWFFGSTNGYCKHCRKPMKRPAADLPQDEQPGTKEFDPTGGDR